MGGIFAGLHEVLRNHARDDLCRSLRALGVPAALAPRGAPEEHILGGRSLGLVTIPPPHGPIRWVNVRKEFFFGDDFVYAEYATDYAIPDPRLRRKNTPRLDIWGITTGGSRPFRNPTGVRWRLLELAWLSISIRTRPVRDPTGVRWRGDDLDLGILRRLDGDSSLAEPLVGRTFPRRPLRIRAPEEGGLWTITVPGGDTTAFYLDMFRPKLDLPSMDRWRCYRAIARHLLDTPIPP
jgi:hypothetical protein